MGPFVHKLFPENRSRMYFLLHNQGRQHKKTFKDKKP